MGIFKRLLGICSTRQPANAACWSYVEGKIHVELAEAPELQVPEGAIRLEGKGLPNRILVVRGPDEQLYAFRNRCTHMGRRIDPLPNTEKLQCCSVSKSTYDYSGQVMSGPTTDNLVKYPIIIEGNRLTISLI